MEGTKAKEAVDRKQEPREQLIRFQGRRWTYFTEPQSITGGLWTYFTESQSATDSLWTYFTESQSTTDSPWTCFTEPGPPQAVSRPVLLSLVHHRQCLDLFHRVPVHHRQCLDFTESQSTKGSPWTCFT